MMDVETIYGELRGMNPWWLSGRVPESQLKPFKRDAYFQVNVRLKKYPDKAVLLRGPRRVGKTMLAYQVISDYLAENDPMSIVYVSYDKPTLRETPPDEVSRTIREIHRKNPTLLVLDEIQYLPDWDRWLKVLVDGKPGFSILATGSSSMALKKGKRESGVGRWNEVLILPLSFAEFVEFRTGESLKSLAFIRDKKPFPEKKFHLEQWAVESGVLRENFREYVEKGGFPEIVDMDLWDAQEVLRGIVEKAIFKDVVALMGIGKPLALENLVYYLAKHPGSILSLEKLSGELEIQRATLENYLCALEDMMLVIMPPNLVGKTRRRKVYLADTGLLSALRYSPGSLLDDSMRGQLIETAAAANLQYVAHGGSKRLAYWRFRDHEVDFVLTKGGKPDIALEVGSTKKKLTGARRFYERYKIPVRVLSFMPPPKQPDGILWLPIEIDLYMATSAEREKAKLEFAKLLS